MKNFLRSRVFIAAASTIVGLSLIGGAYKIWNREGDVTEALSAYQQGEFARAQIEIDELSSSIPSYKVHLYQSYIDRSMGQLADSTRELERATATARTSANKNVLLEIILGKALNAYLNNDLERLKLIVNQAKKVAPQSDWTLFFQGILGAYNGRYSEALHLWAKGKNKTALSPWMRTAFNQIFTPQWETINTARAEIETGQYFSARQALVKELAALSNTDQLDEVADVNFLIGLTYYKEALEKGPNSALPYLKLAFSYISKVPQEDNIFSSELNRITKTVSEYASRLIQQSEYEDVTFYIEILNTYGEPSTAKGVINQLISKIVTEIENGNLRQVNAIIENIQLADLEEEDLEDINEMIGKKIGLSIRKRDFTNFNELVESAILFSANPEQTVKEIGYDIEENILIQIIDDNSSLSKSAPYFEVWEQLALPKAHIVDFATTLTSQSERLWKSEKQVDKSIILLKKALDLVPPTEQKKTRQSIIEAMNETYKLALRDDDYTALKNLVVIAEALDIQNAIFQDRELNEIQLSKAKKLFENGQTENALESVEFIIKMQPDHQEAQLLAGTLAYKLGDYKQALTHLKQTQFLPEDALEALAISEIIAGDTNEGKNILNMMGDQYHFDRENHLRLSLGLINRGEGEQAAKWLDKIENPDETVLTAKIVAAQMNKDWNQVIETYEQLPPPYNQLDGIQSALIDAYVNRGELKTAEKIVLDNMDKPEQAPSEAFPDLFVTFKETVLDSWDRNTTAGLFYKHVAKDRKKALNYLSKSTNLSAQLLLERGELYFNTQQYEKALNDLEGASEQEENLEVQKEALPLLAITYKMLGAYPDSYAIFKQFFAENPDDVIYRSQYAEVLMHIGNYHDALVQYEFLEELDLLTKKDQINFVTSWLHFGDFKEVKKLGTRIAKDKEFSLAQRIEMDRIIIPATFHPVNRSALDKLLKSKSAISTKLAENVLALFLELGEYDNAAKFINLQITPLEQSARGNYLLAKYFIQYGEKTRGLPHLKRAINSEPNQTEYRTMYAAETGDPSFLTTIIEQLREKIHSGKATISEKIHYANYFATQLTLYQNDTGIEPQKYHLDWTNLNNFLNRLYVENNDIPEILVLLGRTHQMLGEKVEALDFYGAALTIDHSNIDAHFYASEVYATEKKLSHAIPLIKQILRFEPWNSQAWMTKALYDEKGGNIEEAIAALLEAIKYNPTEIESNLTLGSLYLKVKNPEDAKEHLEIAVLNDPTNIEALSLLLESLYDPFLELSSTDKDLLAAQREYTYQMLYQLDPIYAENLLSELDK